MPEQQHLRAGWAFGGVARGSQLERSKHQPAPEQPPVNGRVGRLSFPGPLGCRGAHFIPSFALRPVTVNPKNQRPHTVYWRCSARGLNRLTLTGRPPPVPGRPSTRRLICGSADLHDNRL